MVEFIVDESGCGRLGGDGREGSAETVDDRRLRCLHHLHRICLLLLTLWGGRRSEEGGGECALWGGSHGEEERWVGSGRTEVKRDRNPRGGGLKKKVLGVGGVHMEGGVGIGVTGGVGMRATGVVGNGAAGMLGAKATGVVGQRAGRIPGGGGRRSRGIEGEVEIVCRGICEGLGGRRKRTERRGKSIRELRFVQGI